MVIVDPRKKRQDWKLSAQELSMMNKEEESIMPPEVLGKLLSAGVSIPSEFVRSGPLWPLQCGLDTTAGI